MISRDWIKDNFSLILGIFLPIFLVVFFIIAQLSGRVLVSPPKYDLLCSYYRYNTASKSDVYFRLNGNKLQMLKSTTNNNNYNPGPHRLMRYFVRTGEIKDITPPIPDHLEEIKDDAPIDSPSLNRLTLDGSFTSPDGYIFDRYGYSNHGGIFGEIFFSGSRDYGPRIRKGSSVIKIHPASEEYYGLENFIAWIVSEEAEHR